MNKSTKYYSVKETANLLGVHWQTVHNAIGRGELRALKLGRGYRISERAIEDFVKGRTSGAKPK